MAEFFILGSGKAALRILGKHLTVLTMDAVIIEAEALKLPESQRALLADRLMESLSPISGETKSSWQLEADDRLTAYKASHLEAVDGPQALADLRSRLTA